MLAARRPSRGRFLAGPSKRPPFSCFEVLETDITERWRIAWKTTPVSLVSSLGFFSASLPFLSFSILSCTRACCDCCDRFSVFSLSLSVNINTPHLLAPVDIDIDNQSFSLLFQHEEPPALQHLILVFVFSLFPHPPAPFGSPCSSSHRRGWKCSARQSHELRLLGRAQGGRRPPEARPPDRTLPLPG
jgi:hypothetical protein